MTLIKGMSYLFSAWSELHIPHAELKLVGSADDDILTLAKRIGINPDVFHGPSSDTVPIYQGSDVFISPSISDLNPYTVLEAMACGLPVICSNKCGASEAIVNGVNGFVYEYDDIESLQSLILWCDTNREELKVMGNNAQETALAFQTGYDPGKVIKSLISGIE